MKFKFDNNSLLGLKILGAVVAICVVAICIAATFIAIYQSPLPSSDGKSPVAAQDLEYIDAIRVLANELEGNLGGADLFGTILEDGGELQVILKDDYFTKLDDKAKTTLLEGFRDEWVNSCNGSRVVYRTSEGRLVAKL